MSGARCIICDHVVLEEDLEGLTECPKCGTDSIPVDPAQDITININLHELRILTIWADNWSYKLPANSQKALAAILARIRKQIPNAQLTLADEVKEIQEISPNTTLLDGNGNVIIKPKDKPS